MEHWGEIPETSNNLYHDIMTNAVFKLINPSDKLNVSIERSEANAYFQNDSIKSMNQSTSKTSDAQTSPFYDTLKLLVNYKDDDNDKNDSIKKDVGKDIADKDRFVSKSLRDTVILILTYTGFDTASELAVDALVDVLEYYIQSFCQLMRTYTDSIDMQSSNDFCDTITKVLHHMNVPNYQALIKFNEELKSYNIKVKQKS